MSEATGRSFWEANIIILFVRPTPQRRWLIDLRVKRKRSGVVAPPMGDSGKVVDLRQAPERKFPVFLICLETVNKSLRCRKFLLNPPLPLVQSLFTAWGGIKHLSENQFQHHRPSNSRIINTFWVRELNA